MNQKQTLYQIIFEADTPAGKWFDIGLIVTILFSVMVVMMESVQSLREQYGPLFQAAEWVVTILFSIEFCLRLYCSPHPIRYTRSFLGLSIFYRYCPVILGYFFLEHIILLLFGCFGYCGYFEF